MSSRLALGTVQFGLPYGIANKSGQVPHDQVRTILRQALRSGLDTLDTAIGYGASEQRLGEAGVSQWNVISKLPKLPQQCPDVVEWAHSQVEGALARLRVSQLYGLLMHSSADLLGPRGAEVRAALQSVRASGKALKVGVSVYGPEELDALASGDPFDLIQAPFNLVDRRIASSGWLDRLCAWGTEVHVRSVFLQGLLLMNTSERPHRFARWTDLWNAFDRWIESQQVTRLEACLGFALAHRQISRIVVGVDSVQQLHEILVSVNQQPLTPPNDLSNEDSDLINPSRWSLN